MRTAVRIDITGALTTLELDGYDPAHDLLSAARATARRIGAPDLVALTHVQQGVIDARLGAWETARTELRRAEALSAHLGPVEHCSTLITLGFADLSLLRLEDATADLERARSIAREHGLDPHLFKATHNLGCVAHMAGDLPRALSLMAQADRMPVDVSRERARLDHAEALLEAGLLDRARVTLRDALADARAIGNRIDEGDLLLDLARCQLLDGDEAGATALAREAMSAFRSMQATARRAHAELFIAGMDVAGGRNPEQAIAVASRWAVPAPASEEEVEALLVRAEAHLVAGSPSSGARELDRLDPGSTGRLPIRMHELYLRARIAHEGGDDAAFAALARNGSAVVAGAQGAAQSVELRAALAQHAARLAALDLSRAVQRGSPDGVVTTIERWRDASARSRAIEAGADPGSAELLQELRWLRHTAMTEEPSRGHAELRVAELERQIAARTWERASGPDRATASSATPDQLAALLPAGAAYLAFAETDGQIVAALVSGTHRVMRVIGPRDRVRAAAHTLHQDLRGAALAHHDQRMAGVLRRAVARSGEQLGRLLLEPLATDLAVHDRLVVSPNAPLQAVPWGAIPHLAGRPVTVTPSGTRWARHLAPEPATPGVVAALAGPRLRHAEAEVAGVRDAWRARGATWEPLPSGTADTAEVREALGRAEVVHVAAHGEHLPGSPLFSSLHLADGPLFAHEVAHTVGARHVVLSACDVGQARVGTGGESLGMTSALLSFGVASVVAAVAPIPDEVSAAAAVRYHEALASGGDSAGALTAAVAATPGAEALCSFGSEFRTSDP